MVNFEFNEKGKRELERDFREKLSAGIQIPTDCPEAEAIQSVKDQLVQMGVTPNDSEVEKLVRQGRQ